MERNSIHLNGNILCAIDVSTTGLRPGFHDITEVAILPLTSEYKASTEIPFFDIKLKPFHTESFNDPTTRLPKQRLMELQMNGLEPFDAADRLNDWFELLKKKLLLPEKKQLVPLAHNFPKDRAFLVEWLGYLNFEYYFHPYYRDSMCAAMFINDLMDWKAEPVPYARISLGALCNRLEVEHPLAHDAMEDCMALAEVYRRLMLRTL